MSDDDDKVVHLKVKAPRDDDDKPMLEIVGGFKSSGECDHRSYWDEDRRRFVDVTFQIREGETEVECSRCGTRVDPMFVLRLLANKEGQWIRNRDRYHDEMKRLSERSKTKCEHCDRLTRISRR